MSTRSSSARSRNFADDVAASQLSLMAGRIESIPTRLRRFITSRCYLDRAGDASNTVIVAGSPRSGTTWIAEIINARNEYRMMFEPFHPARVPQVCHFDRLQYLPPENDDPSFLEPATRILAGRLRNRWIDQHNRTVIAHKRLIKDVRINLMLGWIHRHLPQIPIVFVLRHPCAVYASRKALGWKAEFGNLLENAALVGDHLSHVTEMMEQETDSFARYVCRWCIENSVPLGQEEMIGAAHIVLYEAICMNPEHEIARLCTYLKTPCTTAHHRQAERPSLVTGKHNCNRRRDPFQGHGMISEEHLRQANAILQRFGLDALYESDGAPTVDWRQAATTGITAQATDR